MYDNIVSRSDSFPKVYSWMTFFPSIRFPHSALPDTLPVTLCTRFITPRGTATSTFVVEPIFDRNLVSGIIRR